MANLTFQDLQSVANNPNAVNHPVTFIDGSVKWVKMTANEKLFYQKRLDFILSDYADFLNAESMGVC